MKRTQLAIAFSALMVFGTAHATTNANDTSAALTISGTVKEQQTGCIVTLSTSNVELHANASDLTEQGENAATMSPVIIYVDGIDNNNTCGKKIYDGEIAVKILGVADNADGVSLANLASGSNAASGVGIGIFNTEHETLAVNTGVLNIAGETNRGTSAIGLQPVKLKNQEITAGDIQGSLTVQIERL